MSPWASHPAVAQAHPAVADGTESHAALGRRRKGAVAAEVSGFRSYCRTFSLTWAGPWRSPPPGRGKLHPGRQFNDLARAADIRIQRRIDRGNSRLIILNSRVRATRSSDDAPAGG